MAQEATPERISDLLGDLKSILGKSIGDIGAINLQARLLATNAQIEAARAGEAGRTFAVVGKEMVGLAHQTQNVASCLSESVNGIVDQLGSISRSLATDVRGNRLRDLAQTNLDIVDRNLYERSCDCRWWATDAAVVNALENPDCDTIAFACERLGVILRAYTVYFDIVLADASGKIVANGRPDQFRSQGTDCFRAAWFRAARESADGDCFGFESMHTSQLVGGRRVLIYSARVATGGQAHGSFLGALGVVFNWDAFALTLLRATTLSADECARTQVCITDSSGRILADRDESRIGGHLPEVVRGRLSSQASDFFAFEWNGRKHLVAHVASRGYETYKTGWHSVLIQQVD